MILVGSGRLDGFAAGVDRKLWRARLSCEPRNPPRSAFRSRSGSDARGILGLVLNEGVLLTTCRDHRRIAGGLAYGAIASQLYGISALDPMVMLTAVAVLGFVSLVVDARPSKKRWSRTRSAS